MDMHLDISDRPKKRLFLALIVASLFIAVVTTLGLWLVSIPGLADISRFLPAILGSLIGTVALVAIGGLVGIIDDQSAFSHGDPYRKSLRYRKRDR
jgi:hypothetical protein